MAARYKVLGLGAEAVIKLDLTSKTVLKQRIAKNYRHPVLDKVLRFSRTKAEARILQRARHAGVPVPNVFESSQDCIIMEFVDGALLVEVLDEKPGLGFAIGENVAKLHSKNIIHGDLTTSNMVLRKGQVYFIDFGLAFNSAKIEDMAVDLHLFKQALNSKHSRVLNNVWSEFVKGYALFQKHEKVLQRLSIVESRGRYKFKKQ